jgi:membrane protease YdiL (CAAX protease family)
MSSNPHFFTPLRIAAASLSLVLLIAAILRASLGGGALGAVGVLKMLGAPAGIAATLIAVQLFYPSAVPADWASWQKRFSRRMLWILLVVVDLMLLGVFVLGIPFLSIMTSE